MIDKVLPGQRVTADTTNKVIDICNGLQTPSESFVNTPNGTLTPAPGYQARYTYSPVPETVLQAKRGPALKMTSRGATRADDQWSQDQKEMTWFCFLGPDTATLTQCLPSSKTPDSIWLGNSDTALFAEVTDSMLSSLRPVGYYADLAAYDEESVAVKEVKLTKSDDQLDPGKNVLVICGASLDDFDKIQEDSRYSEYDETKVVNAVVFAKINEDETPFQLPLKAGGYSQQMQIDLVGDSQLSALELSSCVVRELSGKPFIELHEFHEDNTKSVSDISSDNVDLLIRNPKDSKRELQYLSLSSLSSALSNSSTVDSETNLQLSSIQHNEDNGSLELFDFDDPDAEDFGQFSDSGNYDLVLRKYSSGRELPAEVDYLQLSTLTNALDIKTDTTKTNQQYRSLEEHTQDGKRYFGLYNFETPGYSRTLKVKLNYGATTYVVQSGSGTSKPDPKVQFITRDASGNPFVSYDNIAVTAPRISTSDVDGIETIISGVVTVVSTDLSGLSGDISDLSSQLSNYWKVGGTNGDNCYGQSIGDASKAKAIGLNSRELYAKDGSTALHWNRRVAYDGNGNPAINWSDGVYGSRCLIHRQGMPTVDWLNMNLMGRVNGTTVAWEDRQLKGGWSVVAGTNPGGAASLTVNGQLATTSTLKIGNTTLNETQLQQLLALLNP